MKISFPKLDEDWWVTPFAIIIPIWIALSVILAIVNIPKMMMIIFTPHLL